MQNIKWDGKQKQVNYKLHILLSEMEFFTNLKTKKIKTKSKSKKQTKNKKQQETPEFIDLHLEIISKIDDVIKKNEIQSTKKEEPTEKTTLTQKRKTMTRTPKKSLFQTDNINNIFENNEALFEVERNPSFNQNIQIDNLTPLSNKVTSFDEPLTVENIDFVEKIDNNPNLLKELGLSDRSPNKTTKQKSMNLTIAKTDLEKTKQELERKKHELEEIERLAKEKEEELKKREEEEKKLEKINKIKQKELEKELEKEKRKKEKQLRLEQKKKEKINKIKQKAFEKEKKIKEKQQLLEQKRQEKINKLEEKKLLKEQETNKKLKEKEEKQKQLAQKERLEEIIKKNLKEKEETLLSKKEKIEDIELKKSEIEEKPKVKIEVKNQKTDQKINTLLDEEVGQALEIIDNLLEKLPEDAIYEFIHSKDFEIYERVVNKYNKK